MKWFVPSWCGDYRIESAGDEKSFLSVTKPTEREKEIILSFLKKVRRKGWTAASEVPEDDVKVVIDAPVAKVAPILVKLARPKTSTVTAVKFENGKLNVVEGTDEKELEVATTVGESKPRAAVSVKRPTMSCPQCMPGAIGPATEVLLEFLSPQQHEDWARHRAIEVEGHLSGHRYILAHRHSRLAQSFGRIAWDQDDEAVLHFHDLTVPPEEEILAAKLLLEYREPWVRNEASCLQGTLWGNADRPFTDVFPNPFAGGIDDGIWDAGVMRAIGEVMIALDHKN